MRRCCIVFRPKSIDTLSRYQRLAALIQGVDLDGIEEAGDLSGDARLLSQLTESRLARQLKRLDVPAGLRRPRDGAREPCRRRPSSTAMLTPWRSEVTGTSERKMEP